MHQLWRRCFFTTSGGLLPTATRPTARCLASSQRTSSCGEAAGWGEATPRRICWQTKCWEFWRSCWKFRMQGPFPGKIIRPFAGKSCFGTDTFPEEGSVGQPQTPRNNIYTNAKTRASVVASRKLARSLYARRLKREPLIRLASLADANMLADANLGQNFDVPHSFGPMRSVE
jgi:hypothetical protein